MVAMSTSAAAFVRLVDIIEKLRGPDGCPWDKEQNHATLRKHLIEETYEVIEAIEADDDDALQEELGDLIMQPVMHAQLAAEEGRFDIVEVLDGIAEKLVRRHPHVFGDVEVTSSGEVLRNWDAIKKAEKSNAGDASTSQLSGIPKALPALSLAMEISKKAAKTGFEWPDARGVLAKLREEIEELEGAIESGNQERIADELGDLLFTTVNIARWHKVDPELALRDMVLRYKSRFLKTESAAQARQRKLKSLTPQEWEELWLMAKSEPET